MRTMFRMACVIGLVLLGSLPGSYPALAEKPPLVPRLLVSIGPADWEGPDWQEAYSVALIAVPNDGTDGTSFEFAPNQDCELIAARLAANLGADPDDVSELADFLCASLNDAPAIKQNPLHATTGHVEPEHSLVYWVGELPPAGARAKSGREGDVLLLGTFEIRQVTTSTDPLCTDGGYCLSWQFVESGATEIVHLAVGWFNR